MKTRNGKVARLPLEIREQLNTRLADGEPGNRLVEWLNSNPAVMKVMDEQFEGRPITEHNISEWRAGGYEEWLTLRSFLDETRVLSENADQVSDTGLTSDHLHMVLLAHHAHLLQNWEIMPEPEFKNRVDALKKLTASIMTMQRAELQKARVQLQRERLELLREKQNFKSASTSKAAASTNSRPDATEKSQAATCVTPSRPGTPSSANSQRADSSTPPLPSPAKKSPPATPPLAGPIQSDSPFHPLFPASDPLELTLSNQDFPVLADSVRSTPIHPPKLAA